MTVAAFRFILACRLHHLADRLSPPPPPPRYDYQGEREAQDVANATKAREIAYLARLDTIEQREIQCRDDEVAIELQRAEIGRQHKALEAAHKRLKAARELIKKDRARIRIMDAEIAKEIERLHRPTV